MHLHPTLPTVLARAWSFALVCVISLSMAYAQADTLPEAQTRRVVSPLRQYLMDLDENENGQIEPDELDLHAQYYLETLTRGVDVPFAEPVSFGMIEAAVRLKELTQAVNNPLRRRTPGSSRVYNQYSLYAAQREYSRAVAAQKKSSKSKRSEYPPEVPGFGIVTDPTSDSPGFGSSAGLKYKFDRDDYRRAMSTIKRYDRDKDNALSRKEAKEGTWYDKDPFIHDYNRDGRLDLREFAQRYAKRRIDEEQRRQQKQTASSDSRSREKEDRRSDEERRRDEQRARWAGIDRRTYELAGIVISKHDRNRNGRLDGSERQQAGENFIAADADGNAEITREELARWLGRATRRSTAPAEGVPTWFYARDANDDGQVAMAEFATEWDDETAADFQSYDKNGDGVITPREVQSSSNFTGSTFANRKAQVFAPGDTIISAIEVPSNEIIGDLDVQLSITYTYDEHLDAHLLAPDGSRIELFTGVGSNDDHFEGTILDDEATSRIVSGRPPFRGRYQPEAFTKRQPSLSSFYGKSARGVWQLVITARRADRPGILHNWAILTRTPAETIKASSKENAAQSQGGPPEGERRDDDRRDDDRRRSYGRR